MSLRRHPSIESLASALAYRCPIFQVLEESVRLPSGLRQDLTIVDHSGAVAIAALDAHGRLLLVRQYRHAAGDWLLEVPAGRVEEGEDRLDAARRELEEETGHRAARWEKLREFYTAPGFCSERMTLFVARDLEEIAGGGKAMDDDEELELVRMTPAEILRAPIEDAKTLLAAAFLS